jgi:CheY-like chemotaxis protein
VNIISEILLAEDEETDVFLLRRAFKDAGVSPTLQVCGDGQAAMEFLQKRCLADDDRLPSLVVLDLKMPRRTGIDVVEWMRKQPALRCVPALIFTSSARREDVERAYSAGANAFVVKPAATAQRAEIARFFHDWMRLSQAPLAVTEGFKAAAAVHATGIFLGSPESNS